jgi:tetratricopeptide (TPR) repeat protein
MNIVKAMHKITAIIVFFILSLCMATSAQVHTDVPDPEIDSLVQLIPQFEGKELVDHLNLVAGKLSASVKNGALTSVRHADSILVYSEKALELARSLDYGFGEAEALWHLGDAHFYRADLKEALVHYIQAKQQYEKFYGDEDNADLAQIYRKMAQIVRLSGQHADAEKYYKKARSIYKNLELTWEFPVTTFELYENNADRRSYDSALHYAFMFLAECRELDQQERLPTAYAMISYSYLWREDDTPEQERNAGALAIPYLDSALQLADRLGQKWRRMETLATLGDSYHRYMHPPKYEMAEQYYKQSLELGHELVNEQVNPIFLNNTFVLAYGFLGQLYAETGRHRLSRIYLDSSLRAIDEKSRFADEPGTAKTFWHYHSQIGIYWHRSNVYWAFYKLYTSKGDIDSAIVYIQLREKIRDSIQQHDTKSQIDYLLALEENASTQNRMKLLEQQKELERNKAERFLYLALGLVLLLIVAVLMIRQNRMKSTQEKMGLQQRLFRTQMNPHFIFNSLSSIQHLVVKGDPKQASIFLARFSALVRGVLYSSDKDAVLIKEEVKSTESYLSLQQVRFSNKFDYTVEVDPELDTESLIIPPMLAQPFIENAIEHGIRHKEGKGNIKVSFRLNGGAVHLEVEDDGVGRERSHELEKYMKADHRSMATEITRERLRILNRKGKRKISFEITDLVDDNGAARGTKVSIVLPVEAI